MTNAALGLGIDAGGTQTRWALARPAGEVVASGHVGGLSGLLMDNAAGRERLAEVLGELATSVLSVGAPLAVCAGVTGLGEDESSQREFRRMIGAPLGLDGDVVALRADVEIAYLDLFEPGEGYIVYAGTGSIAAFIDADNVFHRAGGRGVVLDDAGGGYWIARQALRHIWRNEDENPGAWKRSTMAVAMFERLGGSDWLFTRNFVYGASHADSRGDIGKLALAVAATADTDPVAADILTRAGQELARLARAMESRFGVRPMALAGRAIELHPLIEQSMRAALPPTATLHVRRTEAHHAAAHIAAREVARKIISQ